MLYNKFAGDILFHWETCFFAASPAYSHHSGLQWRTRDFIFGGINLTKFYPVAAYDISKRNVVMQVQHTHVINCTDAHLQPRTDNYSISNIFYVSR